VYFRGLFFFFFTSVAFAQSEGSALSALKLLPKDVAKRLARIEARDGAPVPERWYLLVYDPEAERGVREFVVTGGKVVAARTLSQFADSLKLSDVFGGDSVKLDSEQLARWATLFVAENGGRLGSMNFQLTKNPALNGPVWTATVLNPEGDQLGAITVNALKGTILGSDGFEKSPAPELLVSPVAAPVVTRAPKARIAPPTPAPKPSLVRRIFGANEEKPSRTVR
jgi:hypothetical protein